MHRLSLDDFDWFESDFDKWEYGHKHCMFTIAIIRHAEGWHVEVMYHDSQFRPIYVDSLDAAKAVAQILAAQNLELYSDYYNQRPFSKRTTEPIPPAFFKRVFKVG